MATGWGEKSPTVTSNSHGVSLVGKWSGLKLQGSDSSQTAGPQEELPGEPAMSGGAKYNYSV